MSQREWSPREAVRHGREARRVFSRKENIISPGQGVLANTPNALRDGVVGFIDSLDGRDSNYGRGRAVGRALGVGTILGVGVAVAVGVGVGVGVGCTSNEPMSIRP